MYSVGYVDLSTGEVHVQFEHLTLDEALLLATPCNYRLRIQDVNTYRAFAVPNGDVLLEVSCTVTQ